MGRFRDLTDQKFGRLTVLYRLHNYHKKRSWWLCACDCGNLKETSYDSLMNNCKSCGCLRKESTSKRFKTHGLSNTRLFYIWNCMKERCYNRLYPKYKDYGARSVKICDEWLNDFMSFYNWAMNSGYQENLTIDRIDVNGDYEPSNCRWRTNKEQQRNRRNNRYITINDKTHCLSEWCEMLGLNYHTVLQRLNAYHWDIKRALELEKGNA